MCPASTSCTGTPPPVRLSFALQVAATCGTPALFVTCEMAPLELLRRVIARAAGVYLGRLKSGELTREEFAEHAAKALAAVPQLALLDATRAYAPAEQITAAAEALARSPRGRTRPSGDRLFARLDGRPPGLL